MRVLSHLRSMPTAIAIVLFAAGSSIAFASCALPTTGAGAQARKPCSADGHCDDQNRCTDDVCGADSFCTNTQRPNGAPDDFNECTDDQCVDGVESHPVREDGRTCLGTGECKGGKCIKKCSGVKDECKDGNPCTSDLCVTESGQTVGTCEWPVLDGPTPDVKVIVGDCKDDVCENGIQNPTKPNDDDLPQDKTCYDESCNAGEPSVTPTPAGTACGANPLKCDGTGNCKGCMGDGDCAPTNPCEIPKCVNMVCTSEPQPLDPANPPPGLIQNPGDCQRLYCDGAGGQLSQADDTDVPPPDANECTLASCVGGAPQQVPQPNQACATGFCNPNGDCVQCNLDAHCTDASACTTDTCVGFVCAYAPVTCASDGNPCTSDACTPAVGCNYPPVANNTPCPDGALCNGTETCQSGVCSAGTPVTCMPDADPCTIEYCNPNNGACASMPGNNGVACNDGNPCTTGETCSGGTCKGGAPTCPDDGNPCNGMETCSSGTCGHSNPPPEGSSCGSCSCTGQSEVTKHKCQSGSCMTQSQGCGNCSVANCCP